MYHRHKGVTITDAKSTNVANNNTTSRDGTAKIDTLNAAQSDAKNGIDNWNIRIKIKLALRRCIKSKKIVRTNHKNSAKTYKINPDFDKINFPNPVKSTDSAMDDRRYKSHNAWKVKADNFLNKNFGNTDDELPLSVVIELVSVLQKLSFLRHRR